jgi:hypothetical protein
MIQDGGLTVVDDGGKSKQAIALPEIHDSHQASIVKSIETQGSSRRTDKRGKTDKQTRPVKVIKVQKDEGRPAVAKPDEEPVKRLPSESFDDGFQKTGSTSPDAGGGSLVLTDDFERT